MTHRHSERIIGFNKTLASLVAALWLLLSACAEFPAEDAAALSATAVSTVQLEASFSGSQVANGWLKVERWKSSDLNFVQEDFPPDGRGDQSGQRATFFGTAQPHSSQFLLYYGPGWNSNPQAVPVLLVHGANDNADRAWANPNELGSYGCGATTCPDTGLMQDLANRGYRVFAINFSHMQGDNRYWAQNIRDAIEIVRSATGASQVDVIGWSKGAFAARMYVSDVKFSWATAYGGGIRKLVLLGNPNLGFDYIFRHGWSHNFSIFTECGGAVNAPAPHTEMVCYGLWRNHPELSIYATGAGDFYPGQRQMLARWDDVYGLPGAEQDWYTTYYGGQGFYTYGYGIQAAIDQGSLVSQILTAGTPTSVPTYLLAGDSNDIPTIHNEHTGPSDGVVFIDSATSSRGIGNLGGVTVLRSVNHLELGWATAAADQIASWLAQ